MQRAGARLLGGRLLPNMWAIFVDGMDAGGKDLAPSQELLAKPESEAAGDELRDDSHRSSVAAISQLS